MVPRLSSARYAAPLGSPVARFVHPWPIRPERRRRAGDAALASLTEIARELRVHGPAFHTLGAVLEERGHEDLRDAAHEPAGEAAHG